jgi:hypothetical protein
MNNQSFFAGYCLTNPKRNRTNEYGIVMNKSFELIQKGR